MRLLVTYAGSSFAGQVGLFLGGTGRGALVLFDGERRPLFFGWESLEVCR